MQPAIRKYAMHIYIFLFYTLQASFGPFLVLWFSEQGLSNQQIGLLSSIGPMLGLIVQPLWGILSDRFGTEKGMLMTNMLLTPLVAFGFLYSKGHFLYFALVSIFYYLFAMAVRPISETMTVSHAKFYGQSYGSIRVLGSISFALAVTPFGLMYTRMGIDGMFLTHLITTVLACAALLLVRKPDSAMNKNRALLTGLHKLVGNKQFLFFLICIFLVAVGSQFFNVFFGVYVGSLGGDISGKLGILNTVAAISELPFFMFSAYFIKRFGYFPILCFCALAAALRWYVLSLEPTFTWLIVNQLLHGITFALFVSAGINFVYEMSSEGMKTTGQTLFAVVQLNLANLFASNGGGWIIDHADFRVLFRLGSVFSLLAAAGFIGMYIAKRRRLQRQNEVKV